MPFYRVPSGFGGDCAVHHHGRRHPFGPPHHHHHHHGPPHGHHHHHGPPFHPPPHGPPPHMMAGGPPPRFGRRGHRFMMNKFQEGRPDSEAANDGADPAMDGPPFPHHRPHGGPPPPMMMMAGGPPMFGRRGRRFMMVNLKKEQEKTNNAEETNGGAASDANPPAAMPFNKPQRRPHCRRGGPRGMCSDLPRESPVEVTRNGEETNNKTEPETPKAPPGVQCSFRHNPHFHRRRHQHFPRKMMLLSLLEQQKRCMEELEQNNKKNQDADTETNSNPVIHQVPQQWHVDETDQSLILSIDVTGFKLENLELKVENGMLSLQGHRSNSLGDVFELCRNKKIDSNRYNEAGIEARCDNEDDESSSTSTSILRITIPKKEYTPTNDGGAIPIQYVECLVNEESNDSSASATVTVMEDNEKKEETEVLEEDNIFIPEAEIVFERQQEELERLGQVETVEDGSTVTNEQQLESSDADNALNDSDTTQSWEDLIVLDEPPAEE